MVSGLVSRLAPVRPVTAVIKTKHAGLNPMDLGSVALYTTGPLNWWPIGLDCDARHALGIMAGETYRQPL